MFRSGESEDFHLDRNRQETLRNFSALSMHTNRPIKNEIQPRSISTPSLSAVRQRSVFFTRRSFAEIRRVSTGDRSCVQRIHEQLRRSVFFLFHSCFVVCQIRIQRTHIYIHIYICIYNSIKRFERITLSINDITYLTDRNNEPRFRFLFLQASSIRKSQNIFNCGTWPDL